MGNKIVARNACLGIWNSVGACVPISGSANNITLDYTAETPDATGFQAINKENLPDGVQNWELSWDAFYGNAANSIDATLFAILGASTGFAFGPAGSGSGSPRYTASGILSKYNMKFGVNDSGQVSATMIPRTGSLDRLTWA